jgi:ribosomal-protein-alanine N-acetyltransferase
MTEPEPALHPAPQSTIFRKFPMLVSRFREEDSEAVSEIARLAALSVDVQAERERPWALMWLARAESDTAPVAFLLAWAVADELHLIHIATRPEHRRKGAGSALMRTLVDYAVEHRSRLVLLEVRRTNRPAIRLYRSLGFSAIGVRRRYYADGEDAIEMMLGLDPSTGIVQQRHDEVELAEAW